MLPLLRRFAPSLALATLALASLGAAAGVASAREALTDSTFVEHWTLANGLKVVSRHVPGARHAAITLCYRLGSREDPPGREGLAELAAQVAFTARAGDVPGRSLAELDQLRPSGWSLSVGPHLTSLTEAAPRSQLAGVLHQVCQRLRGVSATDSLCRRAVPEVQRRLRDNYDSSPDKALYFLSAELSAGRSAEQAQRYASGQGIDRLAGKDVRALLTERLVPANCTLAIAGDLDGVDLHRLLERETAGMPAGSGPVPIAWGKLGSAHASLGRSDLKTPVAVLGLVAPPLADTLHAYFASFIYSAAAQCNQNWGRPEPPLTHRFQYLIPTDPEFVRIYPPLKLGITEPDKAWERALSKYGNAIVDSAAVEAACEVMAWSIGGPLTPSLRLRVPDDPTVVHTLATTHAALEQFGDEAFWAKYRARFMSAARFELGPLFRFVEDPRRQVRLMLSPGP